MPSSALPPVDWSARTEPGALPEWMDEPCTYPELRACLHDLGRVNALTFGYRPTLRFLDRLIAHPKPPSRLRILDVGSGGGDALNRIAAWAKARGVDVQLIGIDLNPLATRAAQETYGHLDVDWITGDAFAYAGPVDVVLSSLLTHHLPTPVVVRFLAWMEGKSLMGWFINDLERSARSARLFATLARVMRWHPFVQHDGPVSFARSFTPADWHRMLTQSGIAPNAVSIARAFPSRLCIGRFK